MKLFDRVLVVSVIAITLALTGLCGATRDDVIVVNNSEVSDKQQTTLAISERPGATTGVNIQRMYSRLPLHFEANQGQTGQQVKFLARGRGYNLSLLQKYMWHAAYMSEAT